MRGQHPVNFRRVGEKHNILKQADSDFRVRCSGTSRGKPWSMILAFAFCQASFLITFATGGIPHTGSWQRRALVFPSHPEMRVHFPASLGKESRHSRRTSRGDGLKLKVERNASGHATIPKDPDFQIHCRYTWLTCTDLAVIPNINSKHDGMCDSLVAPRGNATDPYVNSTGSLTLLLQL